MNEVYNSSMRDTNNFLLISVLVVQVCKCIRENIRKFFLLQECEKEKEVGRESFILCNNRKGYRKIVNERVL